MNLGNLNKMVIIVALLLRGKKTRNKILIIQIPLFQELKGGKKISDIPCYFPILAKVTFVAKEKRCYQLCSGFSWLGLNTYKVLS